MLIVFAEHNGPVEPVDANLAISASVNFIGKKYAECEKCSQ